ncbi:pantoate--beta-alanine ligase [Tamlana sp. s12]|uniref:pantoate--beta-alanine ligase n=1 Tax=Tamlana sp. s12 TaxID=1630406 RepID=UPI0007FEC1F6|nr:pantoate--beta-alanine ligase [Tamlana sp. s12]OBQ57169.1 pantothenate synthetase [Tamlana sp. s12]QQY82646.1 pantoate--beta-alanine ligase [Tamlana sp. s12]
MEVYSEKQQITAALDAVKAQNKTVGLVPTMGALHEGHLELVKKALVENDLVVVSIFVNPTQFDNKDDLEKYPRTLETDVALLEAVNAQRIMVYAPTINDVYEGELVAQKFDFDGLEFEMEGKFRSGHFDGVGTIVKRLFEIVKPEKAYFGEKDFQQLAIIKKMVEKHDMPIVIVPCAIYRELNGLAMSSRNVRLKPDYKEAAPFIYKTLTSAKEKFGTESASDVSEWVENQFSAHPLLDLEYFIIADENTLKTITEKEKQKKYRAFIAVYADDIRLIDNIALN